MSAVYDWVNDMTGERAFEPWVLYKMYQLGEAAEDLLKMFPDGAFFENVPLRNKKNVYQGGLTVTRLGLVGKESPRLSSP